MSCGGPIFEVVRETGWSKRFGETTAEDTVRFAKRMLLEDLDLLVFVGGDGTAVDVARAVDGKIPILGVPAGVKMLSGVFAETPKAAHAIVRSLQPGFRSEPVDVVDLDEESYRSGRWQVRGLAHARVPVAEGVQVGKGGEIPTEEQSLADLVAWFQETLDEERVYIVGAGTTAHAIKEALGGGTPLGIDVYRGRQPIAIDANEEAILAALEAVSEAVILVSPTARQGCVLGRGTAQISPAVLERVGIGNVHVVATPGKLLGLTSLFVDTGDSDLDAKFPEYVRVRTDPQTEKMFRLRRGPGARSGPGTTPGP